MLVFVLGRACNMLLLSTKVNLIDFHQPRINKKGKKAFLRVFLLECYFFQEQSYFIEQRKHDIELPSNKNNIASFKCLSFIGLKGVVSLSHTILCVVRGFIYLVTLLYLFHNLCLENRVLTLVIMMFIDASYCNI